jgi:uncharacterized protein YlxP (DUF503 family)
VIGVLSLDLRLPASRSLKDKRAAIRPVLDGARRRFGASAGEVGCQDLRQRASLSFAVVGSSEAVVRETLAALERFVWSFPELEVLEASRSFVEEEA